MRASVVSIGSKSHWDIYVGRGSCPKTGRRFHGARFGNPFPLKGHGLVECARLYFDHLRQHPGLVADARAQLAGKVLACWCPQPGPCHAVILAGLANGKELDEIEKEWKAAGLLSETADLFGASNGRDR